MNDNITRIVKALTVLEELRFPPSFIKFKKPKIKATIIDANTNMIIDL